MFILVNVLFMTSSAIVIKGFSYRLDWVELFRDADYGLVC